MSECLDLTELWPHLRIWKPLIQAIPSSSQISSGLNHVTFPTLCTHLIFWDAVDTHGGDGCDDHSDGEQTEELAGDGVSWILQRQPQTFSDVPVPHLLEMLNVSARMEEDNELMIKEEETDQHWQMYSKGLRCLLPV